MVVLQFVLELGRARQPVDRLVQLREILMQFGPAAKAVSQSTVDPCAGAVNCAGGAPALDPTVEVSRYEPVQPEGVVYAAQVDEENAGVGLGIGQLRRSGFATVELSGRTGATVRFRE